MAAGIALDFELLSKYRGMVSREAWGSASECLLLKAFLLWSPGRACLFLWPSR